MDWSNERYCRLFTRDTEEWDLLPWQARLLFYECLRKGDRVGAIQTKHGPKGLARILKMPASYVKKWLPALLNDTCVIEIDGGYLVRNYLDAQEAIASDRLRQRESRDRRRNRLLSQNVTGGHGGVTESHSSRSSQPTVPLHDFPVENVEKRSAKGRTGSTADRSGPVEVGKIDWRAQLKGKVS